MAAKRRTRSSVKAKPVTTPPSTPPNGLPTTWKTYNRETGGFTHVVIAEMPSDHLLAAIAYCERKAVDYQHMTNLSPIETARALWPGYVALVAEAARRFGPAQTPQPVPTANRIIILPNTEKEDV
jgi:hypothetical protein